MDLDVPLSLRLVCKLLTTANGLVRRKDHTMNRWLADRMEAKVPATPNAVKGVFSVDVTVDASKQVWVRIFVPKQEQQQQDEDNKNSKYPTLVYFHGGGFAVMSPDCGVYDIFCRRLARMAQCLVVSVNYRRSPEHRYPTAHDDSYQVVNWLLQQQEQEAKEHEVLGHADLSRIFLCGDSAGGNIVHHVGCRLAAAAQVEGGRGAGSVRGHILIQPFFGGEERTRAEVELVNVPLISVENADWHWKAYLPAGENRDHPCCNVFGARSSPISQLPLPPSLVVIGEYDILKDWQSRYVDGLRAAGKQVDLLFYNRGIHAFHIFHKYPLSRQLLEDITQFITRCC